MKPANNTAHLMTIFNKKPIFFCVTKHKEEIELNDKEQSVCNTATD